MDIEVLVVGGAPVGLTTALELRRRGVELVSFTQDDDGVTATVRDEAGQPTVTTPYLIGCGRRAQRRPQGPGVDL